MRRGVLQGGATPCLGAPCPLWQAWHADGRDFQQQMSRASCLVLILAAIIYGRFWRLTVSYAIGTLRLLGDIVR